MAAQRKKKRPTTSVKKGSSSRKKRTRRSKSSKRQKKSTYNKKHLMTLLSLFAVIIVVVFGYHYGKEDMNALVSGKGNEAGIEYYESSYTTNQLLDDLMKMQREKPQPIEPPKPTKIVHKAVPKAQVPEVVKDVKKELPKPQSQSKIRLASLGSKPKLAIIIDDVSSSKQLNAIKMSGMKLTPAIFPPSELSMTSHHLAGGLKHFMIHLPMESGSKQFNSQYKTLFTHFNTDKIVQRAKELRKLFPHAKYVNNHTGSVFTSDHKAMSTLYNALRKEGFIFVDSRTVSNTKVREIAKHHGDIYIARDVFIDNEHTIDAIYKQLRKAVEIAKKKGHAIAIGHPHIVTMRALQSAETIFNGVEIVYIDEIYKEI